MTNTTQPQTNFQQELRKLSDQLRQSVQSGNQKDAAANIEKYTKDVEDLYNRQQSENANEKPGTR